MDTSKQPDQSHLAVHLAESKAPGCKRSAAEIKARIEAIKGGDWMGTTTSDLIDYLPFEDAKQYLKAEVTAEMWAERNLPTPLDAAKSYLDFAWGKANGCRGLSAGRSLDHMKAWLWLAGFGDVVDAHFQDYEHYGKKQLVIASVLCGFDWTTFDDGEWVNSEYGPSISDKAIDRYVTEATAIAQEALAKGAA